MRALVLLGPPGSGKGTAAKELSGRVGYRHVSTGDLFREALEGNSEAGKAIRPYMDKGLLVPDELVLDVIRELAKTIPDSAKILLDGFPRTLAQARDFDHLLEEEGSVLSLVFLLDVEPDVLERRLVGRLVCSSCGAIFHQESKRPAVDGRCDDCGSALNQRSDDKIETIRKRQKVYEELTMPVIEYYKKKGLLNRVNGHCPQGEVLDSLLALLDDESRT
jgi:adenylate kinase